MVAALGGYAGPATMVLFALAGAGWALVLSAITGRYLPTPRLTLPAPVATVTGNPAALLDMARRWSEWRFPLLLRVAMGGVYLLAVGLLEVKPYWVVFARFAALRSLDFAAGAAIALALAWFVGRPWVRTQPGEPGAETGGPT